MYCQLGVINWRVKLLEKHAHPCLILSKSVNTLGKSSNYIGCKFVHESVRLFNTENRKEIDANIIFAYFDIILVEMSPSGAFL